MTPEDYQYEDGEETARRRREDDDADARAATLLVVGTVLSGVLAIAVTSLSVAVPTMFLVFAAGSARNAAVKRIRDTERAFSEAEREEEEDSE